MKDIMMRRPPNVQCRGDGGGALEGTDRFRVIPNYLLSV